MSIGLKQYLNNKELTIKNMLKKYPLLIGGNLVFAAFDMFTTITFLSMGATEGNPLMALLLASVPHELFWLGWAAFVTAAFYAVYFFAEIGENYKVKYLKQYVVVALALMLVVRMIVVAGNVATIMSCGMGDGMLCY